MTNLTIEETSGVDHPAHLREGWLVVKSADSDAIETALNVVNKESTVTNEEMREELDKARKRMSEMEEELSSYREKAAKAEKMDEEEDDEEALMKAAPEAVVRLFEKARAEREAAVAKAAEVEAELNAQREAAADAEAIEKARGWSNLSLDAEQVGPTLRRLSESAPELAKSVEGILDSVNAQAESADIFAEIGKSATHESTSGDAFGRIQAMAKAAVESGRASTMEQAVADIATENPDLYISMLNEKGA